MDYGIHSNIPIEEYHKADGISSTGINLILPPNCPRLFWQKYINPSNEFTHTPSTIVGSALHSYVLENSTFYEKFAVQPDIDRRTKAGKEEFSEFCDLHAGKVLLTKSQFTLVLDMASSVLSHGVYKNLVVDGDGGNVETSLVWQDECTGAVLRSRPDFYNESVIVDIKTTTDLVKESFMRNVVKYGYHVQAAMACDGLTNLTGKNYDNFVMFVVSKNPPHLIKSYVFTHDFLDIGRRAYKAGAKTYQKCLSTNTWPAYSEMVEDIDVPQWFKDKENLGYE